MTEAKRTYVGARSERKTGSPSSAPQDERGAQAAAVQQLDAVLHDPVIVFTGPQVVVHVNLNLAVPSPKAGGLPSVDAVFAYVARLRDRLDAEVEVTGPSSAPQDERDGEIERVPVVDGTVPVE